MTFSVPALSDEACPRCGAVNPNDRQVTVWRTTTALGYQLVCDNCGHSWGQKK